MVSKSHRLTAILIAVLQRPSLHGRVQMVVANQPTNTIVSFIPSMFKQSRHPLIKKPTFLGACLHSLDQNVLKKISPRPTNTRNQEKIQKQEQPPPSVIPVGAVYGSSVRLPVIGKQEFRLELLSDRLARLKISGRVLQIEDNAIEYRVNEEGKFMFQLSETTKKILRKFRTGLEEIGYDPSSDSPYVVVSPPLPFKVRLQFERQKEGAGL